MILLPSRPSFPRRIARTVVLAAVTLSLLIASSGSVMAQSVDDNQTYGSGTYGDQVFGGTTAVDTFQPTPTSSSPSPSSNPAGNLPDAGARLGLWAAAGALLVAVGLGLYGYRRHVARRQA